MYAKCKTKVYLYIIIMYNYILIKFCAENNLLSIPPEYYDRKIKIQINRRC